MTEDTKEYNSGWVKYPSTKVPRIALKRSVIRDNKDEKWYAFEKIHGSNFQIIYVDGKVSFGSRNRPLDTAKDRSTYFDFEPLRENMEASIIGLAEELDVKQLNVYGELYGGNIQTEIIYQTEIKFKVFDMLVNNSEWLSFEKFNLVKKWFDIIEPFATGDLQHMLDLPVEFTSYISTIENEQAEGFVIKSYLEKGSRLTIKVKASSFVEKHTKKKVNNKKYTVLSTKQYENCPGIKEYVLNTNRIDAWFSKTGPSQIENINNDTRNIIQDAIIDYVEDFPSIEKSCISRASFSMFRQLSEMLKDRI